MASDIKPLIDKLNKYIDKSSGPDGCWNWTRSRTNFGNGYGQFWDGKKFLRAHRFAWETLNGPIPFGMCVCHTCDNMTCCNPNHLYLGTHQDNMNDRTKKKRHNYGEKNNTAKLSEQDVINIRSMKGKYKEIAQIYNVDPSQISRIINRKTWRHI